MCSTLFISFLSAYEKAISSTKAREHICNLSPLSRTNGRGKNHFSCSERDLNESAYERCEAGESSGEDGRKGGHDLGRIFHSSQTRWKPSYTGSQRQTDINEEDREVKNKGQMRIKIQILHCENCGTKGVYARLVWLITCSLVKCE